MSKPSVQSMQKSMLSTLALQGSTTFVFVSTSARSIRTIPVQSAHLNPLLLLAQNNFVLRRKENRTYLIDTCHSCQGDSGEGGGGGGPYIFEQFGDTRRLEKLTSIKMKDPGITLGVIDKTQPPLA